MRRIAVLTLAGLVLAGGCTADDTPASTSTTSPSTSSATTTTAATTTTLPANAGCPDVVDRLDPYLEELGLGHLAGEWLEESGELSRYVDGLDEPDLLAAEVGLECAAEFVVSSTSGQSADAVVAWDEDRFSALIFATIQEDTIATDGEATTVNLAHGKPTQFYQLDDDWYWGEVRGWRGASSLEAVVAVAGDDPEAVLTALKRANAGTVPPAATGSGPVPLLTLSRGSAWGVGLDVPDFTLYPDGRLFSHAHADDLPSTFSHGVVFFTLSDEQVAEIAEMVLTTGVVDGETFENPQQPEMIDGSWLGFEFRYGALIYPGHFDPFIPDYVDPTPAQQAALDLESHLEDLKGSLEATAWTPSRFVVKVYRHGPWAESNTLDWPFSFDLAAAVDRRCTLLTGDAAASFYADLGTIGEDYKDRFKTIWEYRGNTYSVQSIPLLPGDDMDTVPDC